MTDNAVLELTAAQLDEIASLDLVLDRLDTIRAEATAGGKAYALLEPWPIFIRRMRLLTPQSYGVRIQNYFARQFGWTVVPAKLDRGDVVESQTGVERYHEVKATLITSSNPGVNFVQIRPHQDIAGYHLFIVERDYTVVHLWLSKDDMTAELALLGSSAHGTTTAIGKNLTREYAIRFPWTPAFGGTAQRWLEQYQVTSQP